MRKLLSVLGTAVAGCFGAFPSAATAGDGIAPFGIEQGVSIDQLSINTKQSTRFVAKLKHAPEPHAAFDDIWVMHTKKTGVCGVEGKGKLYSIESRNDILELQQKKSNVKDALKEKYGEPRQPEDALKIMVTVAAAVAHENTGISPNIDDPLLWESDNHTEIEFTPTAEKEGVLSYSLRYRFSNSFECKKIREQKKDDNL